jgi:hypothetical protein
VESRLFTDRGIDRPPAVEPDFDSGGLEKAKKTDRGFSSHSCCLRTADAGALNAPMLNVNGMSSRPPGQP